MNKIAKILLPLPFDEEFDYKIPPATNVEVNSLVYVPFGRKKIWGIVTNIKDSSDFKGNLKEIISTTELEGFDLHTLPEDLLKLIDWQSTYTMEQKGKILNLCYNQKFFKKLKRQQKPKIDTRQIIQKIDKPLTESQKTIFKNINNIITKQNFSIHLIDGVTGSGKTEIYFSLIENIINAGGQALILLPEILLTSQMLQRFEEKFGFSPTIWHSGLTEAQKRNSFFAISNGDSKVVMGARSALHLPFKNLSMVILDEEHDASYKQEDGVIYNARDIAVIRAKIDKIPLILCSATPSLESYYNATTGKYYYHKLSTRFNDNELPETEIIDMREEKLPASTFISDKLKKEIENNIKNSDQTLLFLNRKGYAPLLLCGSCGFRFKSPDTSAWMVLHYDNLRNPYLECHHSGMKMNLPNKCPKCEAEKSFRACGPGVQRIAEEVKALFPNARVQEVSKDTIKDSKKSTNLINKIHQKQIDIIIGTQIIAKGYHFPALKLVGVIDGDLGLNFSDLRASERVFQLMQQVSGRAGREGSRGKVMIQTYQPENEVFNFLKNQDRDSFLEYELEERKEADLPPFSRLTAIIVESKDEAKSAQFAKNVTARLSGAKKVEIYGPAKAMYYELRGFYRNRILLKSDKNINIQKYIRESLKGLEVPNGVKLKIDIDPYSFT